MGGGVAGQTVVGTPQTGLRRGVGVGPVRTGRVAQGVNAQEKGRQAGQAQHRRLACGTPRRTSTADRHIQVVVAGKRSAAGGGGAEGAEVGGGAGEAEARARGFAGEAVVGAGPAGVGEGGGVVALLAGGGAGAVPHEVHSQLAGEADGGGLAGCAPGHAGLGHSGFVVVEADLGDAPFGSVVEGSEVSHLVAAGALAVGVAVLAVVGAGQAGEGGVVPVEVGGTVDCAVEVEVQEVPRHAVYAVGQRLAKVTLLRTGQTHPSLVVVKGGHRQTPAYVLEKDPLVGRVAAQTVSGRVAGQTVVGTHLAAGGLLRGVKPGRTLLGAQTAAVHEEAGLAGDAGRTVAAHGAVGEAGGTDGHLLLVVADEGKAALGGVGQDSEVNDGAAGETVAGAVAVVAVIRTSLAGPGVGVGEEPGQAGGVAEVVGTQIEVGVAVGAVGGRGAGRAAGGAPDAGRSQVVKVVWKAPAPRSVHVHLPIVRSPVALGAQPSRVAAVTLSRTGLARQSGRILEVAGGTGSQAQPLRVQVVPTDAGRTQCFLLTSHANRGTLAGHHSSVLKVPGIGKAAGSGILHESVVSRKVAGDTARYVGARETGKSAANALEGGVGLEEPHGAASEAEVVVIEVKARQAAEAEGGRKTGGAPLGTGDADRSVVVVVAVDGETPAGVGVEPPEVGL